MKIKIIKLVEYSMSKPFSEPITVSRMLPDKSGEVIGSIRQSFDSDKDLIVFCCFDADGKEICETGDCLSAEGVFEKIAEELNKTYPNGRKNSNNKEHPQREEAIKEIRQIKGRNKKSIEITK